MTPEWRDLLQLGFSFAVAGLLLMEIIRMLRSMSRVHEQQSAVLPQIVGTLTQLVNTLSDIRDDLQEQGKLLVAHVERTDAAIKEFERRRV